ncbi:sensor histidine kinase [Streptacidiphilus sp. MAP12-20]|uniref:sensor histidine kinase n=1 Tax=Streptacidiphilus sp. MAP12-20 TaxID=3156299 RepID=UPI003518D2B4
MRRWSSWSLRTRLVVVMTVLLALVFTVMAWLTTVQLRSYMLGNLDSKLQDTSARVAVVSHGGPMPGGDNQQQLNLTGVFSNAHGFPQDAVAVGNESGQPQSAINRADSSLTGAQIEALEAVPKDGSSHTVTLPGLGTYLVSWAPPAPGHGTTQIVVGLPESEIDDVISTLVTTEAVLGVTGVIIVGFVGFGLIRVSLRPLDRVAVTAARISRLPLDKGEVTSLARVPVEDTDPRTESGLVGASLNRMIDHVSAALESRHASETRVRQFVADASHELRTPLASIKGYAELTRRSREAVPPDTAYALSRVESEATRMTALVEDLLLLARLDAGRPLDREPVELAPLLVDAVRDAHAAVPDHKWEVRLPEEDAAEAAAVVGDEHRLHQVLVNLLANAGKHTPEGTTVTGSLAVEARWAVLTIADDGPGIPQELLPTVFERFARGDGSRSRIAGSTGLGLAIVAAVVASHGGEVWVTSEPGETVFTVRLPLTEGS